MKDKNFYWRWVALGVAVLGFIILFVLWFRYGSLKPNLP